MFTVHYFDIYGRAEAIRMLLAYTKTEFEDKRIQFQEWPQYKAEQNLEFAQLPVLDIKQEDGSVKRYNQSISILRYLGRRFGLYPTDIEDAWLVDSALDAVNDTINNLAKIHWEADEERKKKFTVEFLGGAYPVFLKAMSARLDASKGKFLVGDKVTSADVLFATFITSYVYNELNPESGAALRPNFEQFETLKKYAETVKAEFGPYLAARPQRQR